MKRLVGSQQPNRLLGRLGGLDRAVLGSAGNRIGVLDDRTQRGRDVEPFQDETVERVSDDSGRPARLNDDLVMSGRRVPIHAAHGEEETRGQG